MNNRYDVFLSVIYVLNDDLDHLQKILTTTVQTLSQTVTDYEIVVVDNMNDKSKSISLLKELTNDKMSFCYTLDKSNKFKTTNIEKLDKNYILKKIIGGIKNL